MVITSDYFINSRVGDLDIISAGWRYMQRTMNQEDRNGFEKMINMPGFSVEKFEEVYLLKRINPFSQHPQTQQTPSGRPNRSNRNANTNEQFNFSGMEDKVSKFLAKWDEFLEKFANQFELDSASASSSQSQNQTQFLQKAEELKKKSKRQLRIMEKTGMNDINEQTRVQEETAHTTTTHVSEEAASHQELSVAVNKTADENIDKTCSVQSLSPVDVPAPKKTVVQLNCSIEKVDTLAENEAASTTGESVSSSLPSPLREGSPVPTDARRPLGTPDSGMISDVSEMKNVTSGVVKPKEPVDPEKMTGRDGRRYRQKLKKELEESTKANTIFNEDNDTNVSPLLERQRTESESSIAKQGELTGKEKRRLKDKLRKERRSQLRDSPESEDVPNVQPDSEPAKPSEDVAEQTENITSTPGHQETNANGENSEENITIKDNTDAGLCDSKIEETAGQKSPPPVDMKEEDETEKMSRGQKKRAKKKANKGVYVVNGKKDGSHTVELLADEYKILKIDQAQQENKNSGQEVSNKEVNVDDAIDAKNQEDAMKKKNYMVAGNLSKNILDNGKWLAYVLDDKDPSAIPKIGEVSNEEVQETIKYLSAQQKLKVMEPVTNAKPDLEEITGVPPPEPFPTSKPMVYRAPKLPELDADFVRKAFADIELKSLEPSYFTKTNDAENEDEKDEERMQEICFEDLKMFMKSNGAERESVTFQTEFAKKTATLFFGNSEFIEFCSKYSTSKYNPKIISVLVRKYIDTRIVFHYERFKKLADRESRRISGCWTHIHESSAYSLMVMLFINSPLSNLGFDDVERVLFPRV